MLKHNPETLVQLAENLHAQGKGLAIDKDAYEYLVAHLGSENVSHLYFGDSHTNLDHARVAVAWIRENHPECIVSVG